MSTLRDESDKGLSATHRPFSLSPSTRYFFCLLNVYNVVFYKFSLKKSFIKDKNKLHRFTYLTV